MKKQDKLSTVGSSRCLPYQPQSTTNQKDKSDHNGDMQQSNQQAYESSTGQSTQKNTDSKSNLDKNQDDQLRGSNYNDELSTKHCEYKTGSSLAGRQLNLKIDTQKSKLDGNSQRALQSQSFVSAQENNIDKHPESESQSASKMQSQSNNKESIDFKDVVDNQISNNSAFKTFSFVSVVMEPSKRNPRSMKARDKTKPIIEQAVINRQIRVMKKLQDLQKHSQSPLPIEFDEMRDCQVPNKKRKVSSDQISNKIVRGNLGFCYLDMSLINLCGIPSLWMDQREFVTSCARIALSDDKMLLEPYIKPYQKNLLRKQYKMYSLLRFHRIFENDKYFGKNINLLHNQNYQNILIDCWQFQTENLKETNNKFFQQQMKLIQKRQETFNDTHAFSYSNNEKHNALYIIQGSSDAVPLDIPRLSEADPAFFKLVNSEAKILKQILMSQNFQQTDQNNWNLLWTSVTLQQRPQIYEQLQDYQKINHFMNSVELTRKDRFADNIINMKSKFGNGNFDFVPETYQFPEELALFQQRFNQIKSKIKKNEKDEDLSDEPVKEENLWIYKPSQSSQGKGIYIIQDLNDLQKDLDRGVLCKYISNPLLVNQHKFDLRVYVLLTSVDPLRIYVYNEGLARFASSPYESSKSQVKNLFSHLTNYSINKKAEGFSQNKSLDERDHGNKWSISDLQSHLEKLGINMQPIWEKIYDAIIKSIISVEHHLLSGCKRIQNSSRPQNCFELFGFDIILDNNFKPYVLEVNFSPSLSADSPLDYHIKSNLLVDTLNIVGLRKNYRKRQTSQKNPAIQKIRQNITNNGTAGYLQMIQAHFKSKEGQRTNHNQKPDINSFSNFLAEGNVDQYFLERLSRISAKHRELVYETLDEIQRNKNMNFTCIYPAAGCYQYDRFFEGGGRSSNQLIHRYLFTKNELFTLVKQISDYQKQCIKNKYGEEYKSQSEENEDNQRVSTSHSKSDEAVVETKEKEQEKEKPLEKEKEKLREEEDKQEQKERTMSVSPLPTSVKLQSDPQMIIEKNEFSDTESEQESESIKKSEESPFHKTPLDKHKMNALSSVVESRSINQSPDRMRKSDNKIEVKSNESPTRPVGGIQATKLISQESFSPIKINTTQKINEESPNKKHEITINKEVIEKKVYEDKLKTPVPKETLPSIKVKSNPIMNESKSVVPSPLDKIPEHQDGTFSYKNSVSKIGNHQKQQVKKDEPAIMNKQPEVIEQQDNKVIDLSRPSQLSTLSQNAYASNTLHQVEEIKINSPLIPKDLDLKQMKSEPQKIEPKNTDSSPEQIQKTPIPKEILNSVEEELEAVQKQSIDDVYKKEDEQNKEDLTNKQEESSESKPAEKTKQKIIITGDDILIEYVNRITKHLESIIVVFQKRYNQKVDQVEDILPPQLKISLERFALHSVWSNKFNSNQRAAPLIQKIKIRHKEMVERRTKILKTQMKQNNSQIQPQEILEELGLQDTKREKIINKIHSAKIEKMVKQSNVENQIDVVSILVEGSYNLPIFLQVQGGKSVINGTLSSLKIFEKILKSEKVQSLQQNFLMMEQEKKQFVQSTPQKIKSNIEFMTETKPTRENSKLFVQSIMVNSSNTQLAYRPYQLQSATKAEKYHLPMIIGGQQPNGQPSVQNEKQQLNQTFIKVLPDAQKRRMTNSGSASGYKNQQVKNLHVNQSDFQYNNGKITSQDTQTYNNSMVQTMAGINNTFNKTTTEDKQESLKYHSISEGPRPKISRQIMAAVHQKNTQSYINSQNSEKNYQGQESNDYQKQQSFDKRQRSYRNDNQMLSMTFKQQTTNPAQIIMLQKELQDKFRGQNLQNNGLQRISQINNYSNLHESDLNLNNMKNASPDINLSKNVYINNTFSPHSTTVQNQKVSNSSISIVKAGEQMMNNNSQFIEFNRSHQGEGFFKKINTSTASQENRWI